MKGAGITRVHPPQPWDSGQGQGTVQGKGGVPKGQGGLAGEGGHPLRRRFREALERALREAKGGKASSTYREQQPGLPRNRVLFGRD